MPRLLPPAPAPAQDLIALVTNSVHSPHTKRAYRDAIVCFLSLTVEAIFQIVKRYSARMNVTISPHDLRRTFAKLAHKGHAGVEQIQFSLGHESVVTTEAYLGVHQDLSQAPCDVLGINVESGDHHGNF